MKVTRTSFDMDPFVVASLGRKTFRTKVIRHNLNPVFDEKMVFQVLRHEQQYSLSFTVVDRDKLSGNDFIGTANFPIPTIISAAPEADPETGLYPHREPSEPAAASFSSKSRFRLPISRSSSATSLNKLARPGLSTQTSQASMAPSLTSHFNASTPGTSFTNTTSNGNLAVTSITSEPTSLTPVQSNTSDYGGDEATGPSWDDPDLKQYTIPLNLKNKEKWNDKHPTQLYIKTKFMPYPALRQQFWRAMLKQYDADESTRVSKIELTTMLDTLGSTLKESTIDRFFQRFASKNGAQDTGTMDLTFDQAVICLEDQLQKSQKKSVGETVKGFLQSPEPIKNMMPRAINQFTSNSGGQDNPSENEDPSSSAVPNISQQHLGSHGEVGDGLDKDDLHDDRGEEHVIEIRECPICHQPRLNKRSDADIITHIATCASQDWRSVNNIVMAGFVTSSQAQRKWYSKVITKISYGGYKLGANSANILVQDRITGQINEERMSVYVRLGIRLLYKGLKSRDMETKRSKSIAYLMGRPLTRGP